MIGLPNRITCIGIVVRTPEQTGLERSHLSVQIILQPRPVPGHLKQSLREQIGPGTSDYRAPKSESQFTFRNNFLSCEVTEVSRNFPAASSQWTSLCNEKSSATSASRTSISASW